MPFHHPLPAHLRGTVVRRRRPRPGARTALGAALVSSALVCAAAVAAPAAAAAETSTPSPTASTTAPPTSGLLDLAPLQALVDEASDDDVRLSIGVRSVDGAQLTDGPVVVGSTEEYSSASVIKLALVTAVLRAVDRGELALEDVVTVTGSDAVPGTGVIAGYGLPYDATVAELCELAITVSDNTTTNVLAELVGLESVDRVADELGLGTTHMGRLLFSDGPSDESNDLDTADTVELLRAIYEGDAMSTPSRALMMGWLEDQQLTSKFGDALDGVPLAHKTGDTSEVSHDAGIILEPGRETVLVVLSETEDGRSPTTAADPYIQRAAVAVHEQSAAAPPAPTPTPTPPPPVETADTRAAGEAQDDAVVTTGGQDSADDGPPTAVVVVASVVLALALLVGALRARVLLRRRMRRRAAGRTR